MELLSDFNIHITAYTLYTSPPDTCTSTYTPCGSIPSHQSALPSDYHRALSQFGFWSKHRRLALLCSHQAAAHLPQLLPIYVHSALHSYHWLASASLQLGFETLTLAYSRSCNRVCDGTVFITKAEDWLLQRHNSIQRLASLQFWLDALLQHIDLLNYGWVTSLDEPRSLSKMWIFPLSSFRLLFNLWLSALYPTSLTCCSATLAGGYENSGYWGSTKTRYSLRTGT